MREKPIEDVLRECAGDLMPVAGVVGVAQGEHEGQPCIVVLVAEESAELIGCIPSTVEGYRVLVKATGEIRALDCE